MGAQPFRNSILKSLDAAAIERLDLRLVDFELLHQMETPGHAIRNLFFVEDGMASMTNTFKDGSQIEVGTFGHESIIGLSALLGTQHSLNRVYTQIAGYGYSCNIEAAKKEFFRCDEFQALAMRYLAMQLVEVCQSAGCNGKHLIDQRLCRWLLICADRTNKTTFQLSHDFLANMIGSSRPTLSIAAGVLRAEGLIEYDRGVISIIDMPALKLRVCECYHTIRDFMDGQLMAPRSKYDLATTRNGENEKLK